MKIFELENRDRYIETPLYHGSSSTKDVMIYHPRERKVPRDTLLIWHNYLKEKSIEKLGFNVRDSLFTVNSRNYVLEGLIYKVFVHPDANFYVSDTVNDMTRELGLGMSIRNTIIQLYKKYSDTSAPDFGIDNTAFIRDHIDTIMDFVDHLKRIVTDQRPDVDIGSFMREVKGYLIGKIDAIDHYIDNIKEIQLKDLGRVHYSKEIMIQSPSIKLVKDTQW